MSFDHLTIDCFLAVTETGSFTNAAKKVSRTQSAVSQQISKLEKHIGKQLFIRGKVLMLTSEGEILLTYAKKIAQLNREAMDRLKQPELHGEVRFGLPEDFASVFLSDILRDYASLHPRILLNVECDLTLNLFERFKKKEFDLVLIKMNKPNDFPNGIDVWSEPLVWVGNKKIFELDYNSPIPLILSPHPCVYRSRAISSLEKIKRRWRIVFSSESYAGKIAAVRADMGITVLPRNMVPSNLAILKEGPTLPKLDDTHISLIKHQDQNSVLNSFEDFVIERLK